MAVQEGQRSGGQELEPDWNCEQSHVTTLDRHMTTQSHLRRVSEPDHRGGGPRRRGRTYLQAGPVHVPGQLDLDPMGHRQDLVGVDLTGQGSKVRVRRQSGGGGGEQLLPCTLEEEEGERKRGRRGEKGG